MGSLCSLFSMVTPPFWLLRTKPSCTHSFFLSLTQHMRLVTKRYRLYLRNAQF